MICRKKRNLILFTKTNYYYYYCLRCLKEKKHPMVKKDENLTFKIALFWMEPFLADSINVKRDCFSRMGQKMRMFFITNSWMDIWFLSFSISCDKKIENLSKIVKCIYLHYHNIPSDPDNPRGVKHNVLIKFRDDKPLRPHPSPAMLELLLPLDHDLVCSIILRVSKIQNVYHIMFGHLLQEILQLFDLFCFEHGQQFLHVSTNEILHQITWISHQQVENDIKCTN